jgi:hypothetical protein
MLNVATELGKESAILREKRKAREARTAEGGKGGKGKGGKGAQPGANAGKADV